MPKSKEFISSSSDSDSDSDAPREVRNLNLGLYSLHWSNDRAT